MSSSAAVQISIVTACRNEIGRIAEMVSSMEAQDFGGFAWEALFADGLSTDGTREYIERVSAANPRIQLIANPRRIVSTGLNLAIRAATGEFVIRMDAHSVYAADYCRRSVEALLETGADNVGGAARTAAAGRMSRAIAAAYHSRFSTGGARFHRQDYEGWVDTVPYGCWRRRTLLQLGLFDENLVRNQDDELNLRLLRAGGRIWQSPRIVSWYLPRPSLSALFHQYFQYGFWKVRVIRKHRAPGSARQLIPVISVAANLLLPLSAALAALGGLHHTSRGLLALWTGTLAAYTGLTAIASVLTARRYGWDVLPYLPHCFVVFHLSYGLGFAAGLLTLLKPRIAPAPDSYFARITR